MPALEDAVQFIRMGNREEGRQILEEILETDENNEEVWLWLSAVVEGDEDREICLENVLALNPNNAIARRGADALHAGRFNANEMIGELLEQEEEVTAATDYSDELMMASEEAEEPLELPSTMSKSKPRAKAKPKAGFGLAINVRLIILLGVVLVVILALGAVAIYSIVGGGDDTPVVPVDTTPAEQPGQEVAATATDTPTATPTPTDTPTPTATRLQLPTPLPTKEPTPTATRVVSPTPAR